MTVKEFEITEAVNLNICEKTQNIRKSTEVFKSFRELKESEK